MPSAHAILYALAGFLGLWGLSLVYRGVFGERSRHRGCPSCDAPLPKDARRCDACGFASDKSRDFWRRKRSLPLAACGAASFVAACFSFWFGVAVQNMGMEDDISLADGWGPFQYLSIGVLAFALVLSAWGVAGERAKGTARCPKCWYDLSANDTLKCSECGFEAGKRRQLYKPRRRWKFVALAALIALAGVVGLHEKRYREGGWVAVIPASVLIASFERWPEQAVFGGVIGADEDWSLEQRYRRDRMWGWQESWLEHRSRELQHNPTSVRSATWAAHFETVDDRAPVLRLIAEHLCSDNQRRREEAGRIFANEIAWLIVWSHNIDWATVHVELKDLESGLQAALQDDNLDVAFSAALYLSLVDDTDLGHLRATVDRVNEGRLNRSVLMYAAAHLSARSSAHVDALIGYALSHSGPEIREIIEGMTQSCRLNDEQIDRMLALLSDPDSGRHVMASMLLKHATYHRRDDVFRALLDFLETGPNSPSLYVPRIWNSGRTPFSADESSGISAQAMRLYELLTHDDASVVLQVLRLLDDLYWRDVPLDPTWVRAVEQRRDTHPDQQVVDEATELLLIHLSRESDE